MNDPDVRLPTLYLSHGSPLIAVAASTTQRFFQRLGPAIDTVFGRPKAVVVMSAHTMTASPLVLGAQQHEAIHDFSGFPPELYALRYDTSGAPALADRVSGLLSGAGWAARVTDQGGLDHGIWTVLMHLWPDASVPVVPLSLPASASPHQLWAMGLALASLDGDVLVMGTGSLTHNLRRALAPARWSREPESIAQDQDCAEFRDWVVTQTTQGQWPALWNYRQQAPHAAAMHPTDEHWRPFYLAAGAGCGQQVNPQGAGGVRLHEAVEYGCLALDAYAFGRDGEALARALA